MITSEGAPYISIELARLSRLRKATILAGEGAFGEALELLDSLPQDELGEAEQDLRALIRDYKTAIEQSSLAIEEFRISKRELLQKLEMIQDQQASIRKLSAPIIDVWDRVVAVPLIGVLDGSRAQDLSERILNHVQQAATRWVILDLTGIELVDARIAQNLIRLASAIRLMGATCLLTGMQASAAKMLSSLGSSFETIRSVSSLREGLKYCLSRSAS